jgi:hypothetical protein
LLLKVLQKVVDTKAALPQDFQEWYLGEKTSLWKEEGNTLDDLNALIPK